MFLPFHTFSTPSAILFSHGLMFTLFQLIINIIFIVRPILFSCSPNLLTCVPEATNGYTWIIFSFARGSVCVHVYKLHHTIFMFFLWVSDTFRLQAVTRLSPWLHFSAYHCSAMSSSRVLSSHIRCSRPLCTPQITQ